MSLSERFAKLKSKPTAGNDRTNRQISQKDATRDKRSAQNQARRGQPANNAVATSAGKGRKGKKTGLTKSSIKSDQWQQNVLNASNSHDIKKGRKEQKHPRVKPRHQRKKWRFQRICQILIKTWTHVSCFLQSLPCWTTQMMRGLIQWIFPVISLWYASQTYRTPSHSKSYHITIYCVILHLLQSRRVKSRHSKRSLHRIVLLSMLRRLQSAKLRLCLYRLQFDLLWRNDTWVEALYRYTISQYNSESVRQSVRQSVSLSVNQWDS